MKVAVILSALVLVVACGSPNEPSPQLDAYTVRGGALTVDVPASLGTLYYWRVARPNGVGLMVLDESDAANPATVFAIAASTTALRETAVRESPTATETFPRAIRRAGELAPYQVDVSSCSQPVVRPFEDGRLWGKELRFDGCEHGTVVRVVAIDAQRTVMVSVEALARPQVVAATVDGVLASLRVDPLALPVEPVADDELEAVTS